MGNNVNPLKSISLLYVEDDKAIQEQLAEVLSLECRELYVASDGIEGLAQYREHQPDIILTDIRMPKLDGLQMSEKILTENPDAMIVVSSAFSDSEYLLQAIKLNIHYYLLKPINLFELFDCLKGMAQTLLTRKELQGSERLMQQYKAVVDESALVSKTDTAGIITYANEAFCAISGYTLEEMIGKPHSLVRHPEMPSPVFKTLWETIKAKKTWKGKIKNLAKDGSFYIVDSTVIPILSADSEVVEYISVRHDITEEELEKERLKKNLKSRAQTLDEQVKFIREYESALKDNTLFCRTSIDGDITTASKALCRLLGYEEDALEGMNYQELMEPPEAARLQRKLKRRMKQRRSYQKMYRHLHKDGSYVYLETSFIPISDLNDDISEVLCFYVDTTESVKLNHEIYVTQKEVISTMGAIGETRSKETGAHVRRVAEYSKLLALKAGVAEEEAEMLKIASPMHDIGKVGIPDSILNKPGRLDHDEFEIMKTHAALGYEMLKGSDQMLLRTAAIIAHEHHEKWDGSGYPRALCGEDIHIFGRITAIADVFDALGHDRVYKKAWPLEEVYELLKAGRGTHFDPLLIDLFFENLDEFLAIKACFDDTKENM